MFNWAFRTTENVVKGAVVFSAPIVKQFDTPISYVDQTLVKGLDKLEERAPIIKEQPAEILNQAKTRVMDVVQPQINKVCAIRKTTEKKAASLKELSYNKAKEVLATSYGSVCVSGIDSTAVLAERLLDSFFPKTAEDDLEDANSTLNYFLFVAIYLLINVYFISLFRANLC
jgi:perilipin-2